jgi:hypothetical protein
MKSVYILLFTVCLAACKKNNEQQPNAVYGYWNGTTSLFFSPYVAINLRNNGTARIFKSTTAITDTSSSALTKSEGTYQMKGDTIEASFPFAITFFMGLSFTGQVDHSKSTLTGSVINLNTGEYGGNETFYGTFTLTK